MINENEFDYPPYCFRIDIIQTLISKVSFRFVLQILSWTFFKQNPPSEMLFLGGVGKSTVLL